MMLDKRYSYLVCCAVALSLVVGQENQRQRHPSRHDNTESRGVRWDIWTEWTPCSVDCGVGVTSRSRACRSLTDGRNSTGCPGKEKEIKVCEITGCVRAVSDQCKELETRMFGGTRYRWMPYTHPRNVCEAACRPVNAGFYFGLGKVLPDGTFCDGSGEKVCVAGMCRTIGCDGIIDSDAQVDDCGVCNGDGKSCSAVRKTFTDDVKYGYHTFATVPRGATNIFVSEVAGSRNYLALRTTDKSFRLNADFRLSRFGEQPGAGSLVSYSRGSGPNCPDECIKIEGPTDVPIELMVLAYAENKGIMYSYNVPQGQDYDETNQEEMMSPQIYIDGDSRGEDKNEGLGFEDVDGVTVSESRGENDNSTPKPVITETKGPAKVTLPGNDVTNKTDALHSSATGVISTGGSDVVVEAGDMYNKGDNSPSPYEWIITEYSGCSVTCGQGKQTAVLKCQVVDKNVVVEDHFCSDIPKYEPEPLPCETEVCQPSWQPSAWSKCSVTCGVGVQVRDYTCKFPDGTELTDYGCRPPKPRKEERQCDLGSCASGWYFSEWPDQCSATCGDGYVQRHVICMSNTGNELTACPPSMKPDEEKGCRDTTCGRVWLAGPWSKCNATCGEGVQTRDVVCAQRQGDQLTIVQSSGCDADERPSTVISCDLPQCGPSWFMNNWGECSVSCGMGYRTRDVRCLDAWKQPSSECDSTVKPRERDSCNMRTCPLADQSSDQDREKTQPPDEDPGCRDQFMQCTMVLKSTSSLCQYKYYQKICCASCKVALKT